MPLADGARALLEKAVGDFEKTVQLEQPYWGKLGLHARGERLSAVDWGTTKKVAK